MESDYLKMLVLEKPDVAERYHSKIVVLGGLDPFTISFEDLDQSIDGVPPVTNMDIVAYLVLTHSFYTQAQMKAYKSLNAYKYFESGFVTEMGTKKIHDFFVLLGKVKHSQRTTLKPVNVWCIIAKDGSVSSAHCSCMAGNSEVCSHVGAILFAAVYVNEKKNSMSCTDINAIWPMPSSKHVEVIPVHDMNWGNIPECHRNQPVQPLTGYDIVSMMEKMSQLGSSCPLMRIVEPFATNISQEASETMDSMFNIFNQANINKSYTELMQIANSMKFTMSEEQVLMIEEKTRKQAQNPDWYSERAGRITASRFKAVCKTNQQKPSLSLIKTICYPTKMKFCTHATKWGLLNEKKAVEEYTNLMELENHKSFVVNEVGLIVNKKYPQLAASPDKIVCCECCLGGCLEVKCPFLLHVNNITDIYQYVKMKNSCLVEDNGVISLNRGHSYYYQVQMQIFSSELLYCDFVVWSPNLFFKERILPNPEFWAKYSEVALKFHLEVIMPELLGRYFTKQAGLAEVIHWCKCNGVDDGRPMLRCENEECDVQWFHLDCVGLKDIPASPWFCFECSSTVM